MLKRNLLYFKSNLLKKFYHERVIHYFENLKNAGAIDKNQKNVGTGSVGSVACGDLWKMQIEVNDEGKIDKAVFKAFGCSAAIASSSYATEILKGMNLDEAENIKNTDISEYLHLPPVKLHCSLLAEEAIKKAIEDYKSKNDNKN